MTDTPKLPRRSKACPICGRPALAAERPFCSSRCREEDLRRWLGGEYRIAGEEFVGENDNDPKA